MITLQKVIMARTDESVATEIYNIIFMDGKKPKLRMWLIKKGVDYKDLDDVEGICKLEFMKHLYKYNHDKISFEKYMWTEFSHILLCHFQSKKSKKYQLTDSLDEQLSTDDGEMVNNIQMDLGFIPNPDYELDFETVFCKMNRIQATICRMIYYSDMEKSDVVEYLGISKDKYAKEIRHIRTIFKEYVHSGMVN